MYVARFAHRAGARVQGMRVHKTKQIVEIHPAWRGYEFFLVRDEIIVVNPRTLEIVAVLEA